MEGRVDRAAEFVSVRRMFREKGEEEKIGEDKKKEIRKR